MKELTNAQACQQIGEIKFLIRKEVVVGYELKQNEELNTVEQVPITRGTVVVSKIVPLLVYHVADTMKKDKYAKKYGKDPRIGQPVSLLISEADYIKWVSKLAADYYSLREDSHLDTTLLSYPPFHDVTVNAKVLQEGVMSAFYNAIGNN